MGATRYTFQRGGTIQLALDIVSGDPTAATVSARLQRKVGGDEGADFEVEPREEGGELAGWLLTIGAAASLALPAGVYEAARRIEIGEHVDLCNPVSVRITDSPASGE